MSLPELTPQEAFIIKRELQALVDAKAKTNQTHRRAFGDRILTVRAIAHECEVRDNEIDALKKGIELVGMLV